MPTTNFEFIQESPVAGVGFIYKSSTDAYYFDGTNVYPIRQTANFVATTGSGTTVLNISQVNSGSVAVGMELTGLSGTARIVSFGTFNGTSGTVNLSVSRTWTNPTTVTGLYSNNKAATVVLTTGSGTTTVNIGSVTNGNVVVGQRIVINGVSSIINSFGTFNGTSGTVVLSHAITFTNPTTAVFSIPVINYPDVTVRGIVYLNGTYYVMTPAGSVYGSNINDPLTWSALNVIQCQAEPDGGVCLARQLNLIVAYNAYSTEFFYDAGNPVGSPLLPYSSSFIELGCASGASVASAENTIYFIGVSKQKGRGLYRLNGTNPEYVSTPFIDRLLNSDNLVDITAHCIRIGGHTFYILYLPTTGITLVYDSTSKEWAKWTMSSLSTPQTLTSLTWSNRLVTGVKTNHGFKDGDLTVIAGVTPAGYNGKYTINVTGTNTFTYDLAINPGTVTVQGTAANYTQAPFAIASYTSGANLDLFQDSTTGFIYALDNGTYEDNGKPIEVLLRTYKYDAGSNKKKFTSQLEIIGDKVASTAYLRYSNDDYQTWSKYRPVDLNAQRSLLNRLGQTRRRPYEIRHHDNTALRLEALEMTITEGTQ